MTGDHVDSDSSYLCDIGGHYDGADGDRAGYERMV